MRLAWSAFAIEDRERIFDHREAEDPRAAALLDRRIAACAARLTRFPESGRPGRVPGTRELVIGQTPYIAAYVVTGEAILILRVLHGARRWPGEETPDPGDDSPCPRPRK